MKNLREIVLSIFIIILLALKVATLTDWIMPTHLEAIILVLFTIAITLYAGMIFRENVRDEREAANITLASRIGFFAGVAVLSVVYIVESILGVMDVGILIALALMIVVKLVVLRILDRMN